MKVVQVKRLRELGKENDRLKIVVADLSLDKAILIAGLYSYIEDEQCSCFLLKKGR